MVVCILLLAEALRDTLSQATTGTFPFFFGWAQMLCSQLCQKGKIKEGVCRSMPDCIVDMSVLGSIVTIEAVGGPTIPMTWGRKKGTCTKVIETPFSKDPRP